MAPGEQLTLLGIVLALGTAIVSWSHARTANRHAGEALALARSADARADRMEQTARERRDVVWNAEWDDNLRALVVRNVGTDTAHAVELVVDVQITDRRFVLEADQVAPTETITADLTESRDLAHREWDRRLQAGIFGSPHMGLTARIAWRSETGVPGIESFDDLRL